MDIFDDLNLILSHTNQSEFRELFRPLVTYLTNIVGEKRLAQAIVENERLPKNVKGEFMTAYEFYVQKGKDIGIEQGEAIGIEKGEAIGIEKGEYQKSLEIAKTALLKGFDIQTAAELTDLDVKTVEMLAEQLKEEL